MKILLFLLGILVGGVLKSMVSNLLIPKFDPSWVGKITAFTWNKDGNIVMLQYGSEEEQLLK
jgi:hypothetical protein